MKNKLSFLLIMFVLVVLLSNIALIAMAEEKLQVAFVYHSVVGDFGWFYGHDRARKVTDEALDFIETIYLENVTPGATAERVMTELCKEGYEVIVCPSADGEADVLKVAEKFPDVSFLLATGTVKRHNVESYDFKNLHVWYMLGQIAGKLTKTNTIGMTGAVVNASDLMVQNIWLLGAQSVNPDVEERIIYINGYYDPAAEKDVALSLIDSGADVVAQATNTAAHVQAAQEFGVYAMCQYEDMRKFGPDAYVSGDKILWENYYIPTFTAIRDNTWEPSVLTYLSDFDVIQLADYGPMVTDEIKEMIEETKKKLKEDPQLIWDGPIYDVDGNVKVKEGERLTPKQLLEMNWWVKGTITSMTNK